VESEASSGSDDLGRSEYGLSRTRVVVVMVTAAVPLLRTVKLKLNVCPGCTGFGLITNPEGTKSGAAKAVRPVPTTSRAASAVTKDAGRMETIS
jgi:hypothetical protein